MTSKTTFWSDDGPSPSSPPPAPLRAARSGMPFPTDALPDIVLDAVDEVAALTQAPRALVASSALATISACVQDLVDVRRNAQLQGPAGDYFLVIARSGERKSTVDSFFTRAVRKWEAGQREIAKPAQAEFDAAQKNWDAIDAGLREAQKKAARDGHPSQEIAEKLVAHEAARPQRPRVAFLIRGDDTPEAFLAALDRWPVAFAVSAEAALVFGGPGMNADTIMRSLSQLNIAWDGGRIQRARTTGQNADVEGMRVTVCWQVQPDVFTSFLDKYGALATGMGFLARFLICEPPSTQGSRMYAPPPDAGLPALGRFDAKVTQLLSWSRRFDEAGRLELYSISFDPLSQDLWIDFHDAVEEQLGENGRLHPIQGMASKAAEHVARIACCLEVFCHEGQSPVVIRAQSMHAATAIVTWYLEEALRIFDHSVVPPDVLRAENLERWLAQQQLQHQRAEIPVIDVSQKGPAGTREAKSRDAAIELLVSHNRALQIADGGKRRRVTLTRPVLEEWCEIFGIARPAP